MKAAIYCRKEVDRFADLLRKDIPVARQALQRSLWSLCGVSLS